MGVDEELASLKLDRPGRVKTQDQMARHTLDTQFDDKPIERSVYLLTKGDDVQKLSILQNLPLLYQTEPVPMVNRILPKIQQELTGSSSEFNIAASKVFQTLIQNRVPYNFLGTILQGIDSRDHIISMAWIETLLEVVNFLPEQQIKIEVIKWAVSKSQSNKPTIFRVASCHLLGKCSIHPKIEPVEVKTQILPTVQLLCQDSSFEVRASIGSQLSNVAQGLKDPNIVKVSLLPFIVEMAKDTNSFVRSSSIVTISSIMPNLPTETKTEVIIPLLKQLFVQSTTEDDIYYPIISREYGKFMVGLLPVLTQSDISWFFKFFKTLSTKGLGPSQGDNVDPTQGVYCRHFCAQCLPTITPYIVNKCPNLMDMWYSIFRELAADPCYIVRKTMGGNLHDICSALGPNCKLIKQDIVRLLRDDAEDVLQMLVPKLGLTIELLVINGLLSREASTQTTLEIGRSILKCQMELSKGTNWRTQTDLLSQLEHLTNCLPSDFIHQHFTPVIFAIISDAKAKPVKIQAARCLLVFMRYNIKEIQRRWIRDNLHNRLYSSNSCYTRVIFIKTCEQAMQIFSRKYFKEHFFTAILSLLDDKVLNIRLCTIYLLPQLRAMILPDEKQLLQNLETMTKRIEILEQDNDVLDALKYAISCYPQAITEANKQDSIQEEKMRQEDEMKISQGKIVENHKILEGLPQLKIMSVSEPKPVGTKSTVNIQQRNLWNSKNP